MRSVPKLSNDDDHVADFEFHLWISRLFQTKVYRNAPQIENKFQIRFWNGIE